MLRKTKNISVIAVFTSLLIFTVMKNSLAQSALALQRNFAEISASKLRLFMTPETLSSYDEILRMVKGPIIQSLGGMAIIGYAKREFLPKPFGEMSKSETYRLSIGSWRNGRLLRKLRIAQDFKPSGKMIYLDVAGFEGALMENIEGVLGILTPRNGATKTDYLRDNVLPVYVFLIETMADMQAFLLRNALANGEIGVDGEVFDDMSTYYLHSALFLTRALLHVVSPDKYPASGSARNTVRRLNMISKTLIEQSIRQNGNHKNYSQAASVFAARMGRIENGLRDSINLIVECLPPGERQNHALIIETLSVMYARFAEKLGAIDKNRRDAIVSEAAQFRQTPESLEGVDIPRLLEVGEAVGF